MRATERTIETETPRETEAEKERDKRMTSLETGKMSENERETHTDRQET